MKPGVLAVAVAGATLLGGCTSMQKLVGLKKDLKGKPVARIEAALVSGDTLCPGVESDLVVTAYWAGT